MLCKINENVPNCKMNDFNVLIYYLSDLIEKILSDTFKDACINDLSQQQLHYLQVILRMGNPTITELANELKLTKPTVTALVDKMVKKGYVKRVPSDSDRRMTHLCIDQKGEITQQLRQKAFGRLEEVIGKTLNSTEVTILTEVLKKLATQSETTTTALVR